MVGISLPFWGDLLVVIMKFQFIGNFMVNKYFVGIVGPHFQWLEFHIKMHGMARKRCVFSVQKAGKRSFFSETLAGLSTLNHWTP